MAEATKLALDAAGDRPRASRGRVPPRGSHHAEKTFISSGRRSSLVLCCFAILQSESSCRRTDTFYSTFEQSPKTQKTTRRQLGACRAYERFSIYFGPGRLHGARVSIRRMGGEGPVYYTCLSQGSTAYRTYLVSKQQVESLAQPYIYRPWEACTATIFNSGHAV